jgi:hypothetical protein
MSEKTVIITSCDCCMEGRIECSFDVAFEKHGWARGRDDEHVCPQCCRHTDLWAGKGRGVSRPSGENDV